MSQAQAQPVEDPEEIVRDIRGRLPLFRVDADHLALIVVDMQYLDASPDWGYGRRAREAGVYGHFEEYFARLASVVIPNIRLLLDLFHAKRWPVVYLRVASRAPCGVDASWRYKMFGIESPPGSKDREIIAELAPLPDDIVLDKTTSGGFNSTNLDQVLRNMGVNSLVITGVATNGCVETTTRGAGDLGYRVYLLEDGTATYTARQHSESLADMDRNFARVLTTAAVLEELSPVASVPAVQR